MIYSDPRCMMMTVLDDDLDDITFSNVVKTLLQGGANPDVMNNVSYYTHTHKYIHKYTYSFQSGHFC